MQHVKYLDGWRGLAIGGVLLNHFAGVPGFSSGRFGVDLFFVLSGLLMSRILFEERTPLPTFYRRRISRILPVFLLFVFAMYLLAYAKDVQWSSAEIVSSLLFLRTYFPSAIPIWETKAAVGHFWSLNVEEHCYIFLALIAAVPFLRRVEGWFLAFVAGLCLVIFIWYWKHPATTPDDYALRTEVAAVPLLLSASWRQIRGHFSSLVRPWMAPLALLIGASCYLWAAPHWMRIIFAPFFLAFSVNEIGGSYRWIVRALEWRPLCMVGIWSYSLYLWQQPFYQMSKDGEMITAIAFACAVAFGLASFYFFEKPTREWLNANWKPKALRPDIYGTARTD